MFLFFSCSTPSHSSVVLLVLHLARWLVAPYATQWPISLFFFVQQITGLSLDSVRCWWGTIGGAINHLLVCEYFMWRQSAGKVGVCHSVLPFSPSANHLLYSLGEYTSFIIVCNSFCALRQRWVIPLPPLQNPAFTNPDSFFSHIRTVFIRFPSLEFWGIVVFFLEMSFSWHCRFRQIFHNACHAHAWRWILWEKHPSLPFSFLAPSPLVRVPFFKINIRFTRPRPCL